MLRIRAEEQWAIDNAGGRRRQSRAKLPLWYSKCPPSRRCHRDWLLSTDCAGVAPGAAAAISLAARGAAVLLKRGAAALAQRNSPVSPPYHIEHRTSLLTVEQPLSILSTRLRQHPSSAIMVKATKGESRR